MPPRAFFHRQQNESRRCPTTIAVKQRHTSPAVAIPNEAKAAILNTPSALQRVFILVFVALPTALQPLVHPLELPAFLLQLALFLLQLT
jgi:hypothetical protein